MQRMDRDDSIGAMILTGVGDFFSLGVDSLTENMSFPETIDEDNCNWLKV